MFFSQVKNAARGRSPEIARQLLGREKSCSIRWSSSFSTQRQGKSGGPSSHNRVRHGPGTRRSRKDQTFQRQLDGQADQPGRPAVSNSGLSRGIDGRLLASIRMPPAPILPAYRAMCPTWRPAPTQVVRTVVAEAIVPALSTGKPGKVDRTMNYGPVAKGQATDNLGRPASASCDRRHSVCRTMRPHARRSQMLANKPVMDFVVAPMANPFKARCAG